MDDQPDNPNPNPNPQFDENTELTEVERHDQELLGLFTEQAEQAGFAYQDNSSERLGSANSAHGVRFGTVTDQQGEVARVAVKTFEAVKYRASTRARTELRNMERVRQRGFNTLSPFEQSLFVVPNDTGETVFMVTERRGEMKPMNGLDWQKDPTDEGFEHLATIIEEIADFTAEMHAAGVVHNDWQLKNIVMTTSGEFVLVDLEKALVHREALSPKTDPIQLVRDIRVLFVSLLDNGFMPGSPQRQVYDYLEKHLVDTYLERLRTHVSGNEKISDEKVVELINGVESSLITSIHGVEEQRAGNAEEPRVAAVARHAGRAIKGLVGKELVPV